MWQPHLALLLIVILVNEPENERFSPGLGHTNSDIWDWIPVKYISLKQEPKEPKDWEGEHLYLC